MPADEAVAGYDLLRTLIAEVDRDVDLFALDRAYMVAGGPLLTVASRLGWPQADVFLSYVMAVRRLANHGRTPATERRSFTRSLDHYREQHAIVTRWLNPVPE